MHLNAAVRLSCDILFQRHAKGQVLLQQVFEHLELIEKDYFGLQYIDTGPESEGMVCMPCFVIGFTII